MLRPRESGSTTHLWVKSPDRLGMSTMDVLGVVQDLAARGVGVEFIDAPTLSATTSQGEFMLIILAAAAQLERSMIVKPRGSSWPRCVASTRRGPSSRSSRSRRFVADGVVLKVVVARDLGTDPVHDSGGRRSLRA